MKLVTTLLLFCLALVSNAQMVTNWTTTMPSRNLPVDFIKPVYAKLTNAVKATGTIYIDAETFDGNSDSTTFKGIAEEVLAVLDSAWLVPVFVIDTTIDAHGILYITDMDRDFDTFTRGDKRNQIKTAADRFKVSWVFHWKPD